MYLQKTIRAKVYNPTQAKHDLLNQEYANYQTLLSSLITNRPNCIDTYKEIELYSATKQQALRFAKRNKPKPDKEQPLIIRRDVFTIKKNKRTKITKYWVKIPVNGVQGGIWLPIKLANKHRSLLRLSIRQARLTKCKNEFFIHITVQKQMEIQLPYNPRILSIDLGEKNLAASVELTGDSMNNPRLYGKEARGARRHFAWLRKRLGREKKLKTIKKIANREKRTINDLLHKISSSIVKQAKPNTPIAIGDLKGIRNNAKGKRFNRIVSNMPFYKLTQYIIYKALWQGNAVIKLSEKDTSKTCHRCGKIGTRPSQGLFKCLHCRLQYNADLNAAINLANRCLEYILGHGVNGSPPGSDLNSPMSRASLMTLQDPHIFRCG